MKIKIEKLFNINFLLFFILGFLHFVVVTTLNSNIDSIGALFILLFNGVIIHVWKNNLKLNKKGLFKLTIFFIFFIILILYSVKNILLTYAISYNIYLLLELFLLLYILSNIDYNKFKMILLQFRNAYLIVNIPLFSLYLIDIINVYNFPNRFIVFDNYRFGGFVSEPRGLAIFTLLALLTTYIVKRKSIVFQKFETLFYIVVLVSTVSNSLFIFLLLYPLFLYFFKLSLDKKIFYIIVVPIILYIIWLIIPDFTIGRLTVDKESLEYIFSNLSNIKDIDIGGVNALNIRLWIFLKGIFEIHWWGLGFESATNIAKLQGYPQSDAIGIITIFTDFGWVVGSIIVFYMVYIVSKLKYIDYNAFKMMVGLFVLLFMSPPYAKFYLLFYVYYFLLFSKFKKERILCLHQ